MPYIIIISSNWQLEYIMFSFQQYYYFMFFILYAQDVAVTYYLSLYDFTRLLADYQSCLD